MHGYEYHIICFYLVSFTSSFLSGLPKVFTREDHFLGFSGFCTIGLEFGSMIIGFSVELHKNVFFFLMLKVKVPSTLDKTNSEIWPGVRFDYLRPTGWALGENCQICVNNGVQRIPYFWLLILGWVY